MRRTFQNQNSRIAGYILRTLSNEIEFQIIIYQTDFTIGENIKKLMCRKKKRKNLKNEREEQEFADLGQFRVVAEEEEGEEEEILNKNAQIKL